MEVECIPLIQNVDLPQVASPTTRRNLPKGYGIQEQCLPFTAATALGFLIGSPITFGYCSKDQIPNGAHALVSPVISEEADPQQSELLTFYVEDDYECNFVKNAFYQLVDNQEARQVLPGLSFFDRNDQQDMIKLHLPYILRTPENIDALFIPAINRNNSEFRIQAGLVESDWYANFINLVLQLASNKPSFHIRSGESIAQVVFINREHRSADLKVLPKHAKKTRTLLEEQNAFFQELSKNKSVYKKLARSRDGIVSE